MAASSIILQEFTCQEGIQRDGTPFSATAWTEGQWVRFYNGKPKKMGGFHEAVVFPTNIVRTMDVFIINNQNYAILGMQGDLVPGSNPVTYNNAVVIVKLLSVEPGKVTFSSQQASVDISPLAFNPGTDNQIPPKPNPIVWQFQFAYTSLFDKVSKTSTEGLYLIATYTFLNSFGIPAIQGNPEVPVYTFLITTDNNGNLIPGKLAPLYDLQSVAPNYINPQAITCTGGIQVVGSYLLVYGNNGSIVWNNGDNLAAWQEDDPNIGFPVGEVLKNPVGTVGGGATSIGAANFISSSVAKLESIGCLIFSKTYVVQVSLADPLTATSSIPAVPPNTGTITQTVPTNQRFSASYADQEATCFAANSVIGIPPAVFWVGLGAFYTYNGSISEVDNFTNKLFFFSNVDTLEAAKIYSYFDLTYHEWHIAFPNKNSLDFENGLPYERECNWEIIYNYKTNVWYDTALSRAAAVRPSDILPYPVLSANIKNGNNKYPVYIHEIETDAVDINNNPFPIKSYITGKLSLELGDNPSTRAVALTKVVYDFIQSEKMDLFVKTQAYPRTDYASAETLTRTFTDKTSYSTMNIKGTILTITFQSNTIGGDYFMGKTMVELTVTGDKREEGGQN